MTKKDRTLKDFDKDIGNLFKSNQLNLGCWPSMFKATENIFLDKFWKEKRTRTSIISEAKTNRQTDIISIE